jgi:hypothetical protein
VLCWPLIIVEVAELAPCFAGSVKIIIMYQLEKRTGGFGDLYQWKRAVAGRERRRVCYKLKSFKIKTTIIIGKEMLLKYLIFIYLSKVIVIFYMKKLKKLNYYLIEKLFILNGKTTTCY